MRYLLAIALLLLVAPCMAATVSVPYTWTASTTADQPDNPVRYNLYTCTDSTLQACTKKDVGSVTQASIELPSGSYWVYVTAWMNAISADNPEGPVVGGPIVESDKSNVVPTRIIIPPGNPGNAKIKF